MPEPTRPDAPYPDDHDAGCIGGHDPEETPCLDDEDVRYLTWEIRHPEEAERWG